MEKSLTSYDGHLSSEVRIQLTDLLKAVAVANIGTPQSAKKLCSIAIEMLDNAHRYCSSGNVSFLWTLRGDTLVIRIENRASENDAMNLLRCVESVNAMSPEELTAAFRAQLQNGEFGEKGGAGLGFMDIARKAKARIDAEVQPLEDGEFLCSSQVATSLA